MLNKEGTLLMRKYYKILTDPKARFYCFNIMGFYNKIPDDIFLKKMFKLYVGYSLRLDNPQTFNEKIQWIKLYDRKELYTILVDKYKVRSYVADKIGNEYLIPLLGVWDTAEKIDFDSLPAKFVLKCNHNSGVGLYICKDKTKMSPEAVRKGLKKGIKQDYYLLTREWAYKNVPRRIIAEKYMENSSGEELMDYKLMCFNGKVKCSFVCSDRFSEDGLKVTFFDNDWNVLPFERHYPRSNKKIEKPQNFEKMIELAEVLAKDIPFVRVDFYEIDGKIYFGELTLYPGNGMEEFTPETMDYEMGKMLRLPCE